jgi:hypothetical protein
VGGAVAGGCAKKYPPAVASNLVLAPEEENQTVFLETPHEREALAAMRSVTGEPHTAQRPAAAPRGRWADVRLAVAEACDQEGVEMTVVRLHEEPDQYVFELRTVESWPGRLVIRRGTGGEVYRVVEVTIGRFPEEPQRVERAQALLKAFGERLERLGRQRWFND